MKRMQGQRRAELALHQGQRTKAHALLDEALDLARQTDIGFHLFDRIYGTRITLAEQPEAALAALEEAQEAAYEPAVEYLANIVMRLPAWDAALKEVRGHLALARGQEDLAPRHFAAAADRFAAAGHPLDSRRCRQWATQRAA